MDRKIARDGFLRWFFWAFFNWKGQIKRLPYIGAFVCLVMVVRLYVSIAAQTIAVYLAPPATGAAPDPEYVLSLVTSTHIVPFLVPVAYIYIVLDLKRLRSIGLSLAPSLALVVLLSALTPFVPIAAPEFAQMIVMSTFAYHAILAVIPAKEDRLSPLERKYRAWQAIATGDGTPRRLAGKDIKEWRIVRQGPAK